MSLHVPKSDSQAVLNTYCVVPVRSKRGSEPGPPPGGTRRPAPPRRRSRGVHGQVRGQQRNRSTRLLPRRHLHSIARTSQLWLGAPTVPSTCALTAAAPLSARSQGRGGSRPHRWRTEPSLRLPQIGTPAPCVPVWRNRRRGMCGSHAAAAALGGPGSRSCGRIPAQAVAPKPCLTTGSHGAPPALAPRLCTPDSLCDPA